MLHFLKNKLRENVSYRRIFFFSLMILAFGCGVEGLKSKTPRMSAISSTGVHALFDLEEPSIGPFPSDQFTVADSTQLTGRLVSLPRPDCSIQQSDCEDLDFINTLDGFNLQPRLTVTFDGPIDISSVDSANILIVEFGAVTGSPKIIGINQIVWEPTTNTLYVESDLALAQHSEYAVIVTRGILDASGQHVSASDQFENFIRGGTGYYHTLLSQGLRSAETVGINRDEVVTASAFTTMSVTAVLEKIRDQIKANVPKPALFVTENGTRTVFPRERVKSIVVQQQRRVSPPQFVPSTVDVGVLDYVPGSVGTIAFGRFMSNDYQTPDKFIPAVGTLVGDPVPQNINELGFDLILPSGPKPLNGWPVVIFGHGGTGSKEDVVDFASKFAEQGLATIGLNNVGTGFGPLSTLHVILTDGTEVVFPSSGRGVDMNGDNIIEDKEGFDTVPPYAIVTDRDGRRQTLIDDMQLIREIEIGMDVDGDGLPDIDPSRIYYWGGSNGGINSFVLMAIEPNISAAAAWTAGGSRVEFRRMSPVNRQKNGGMLAQRIPSLINSPGLIEIFGVAVNPPFFNENKPLRNLPPVINDVSGAIEIQTAFENQEWVNQPADPVTHARFVRKAPLPGVPVKSMLVAFPKGDQHIPNPTEAAVVRSGDLADVTTYYRYDLFFAEHPDAVTNPHGLAWVIFMPLYAEQAAALQQQAAIFLASGGKTIIHPEPARFFEVPISLPLPESTQFLH